MGAARPTTLPPCERQQIDVLRNVDLKTAYTVDKSASGYAHAPIGPALIRHR